MPKSFCRQQAVGTSYLPFNARLSRIHKGFYSDAEGAAFPAGAWAACSFRRDRAPPDRDLQPEAGPAIALFTRGCESEEVAALFQGLCQHRLERTSTCVRNGTAQLKMLGRPLVPCEGSDRIRTASLCSAGMPSFSCLARSKVAQHFSKAGCVSEVLTQTLMFPAPLCRTCCCVPDCSSHCTSLQPTEFSPRSFLPGENAWTGAVDVSWARVKCCCGAVGSPLKAWWETCTSDLVKDPVFLLAAQPAPIRKQDLKQGLESVCPLLRQWHCHCFCGK